MEAEGRSVLRGQSIPNNSPQGRTACGARQAEVEQQTICAKQVGMASMPGQKRDEAKVETEESKWRELAERGITATEQQEADG
jgi:hypothetical protein